MWPKYWELALELCVSEQGPWPQADPWRGRAEGEAMSAHTWGMVIGAQGEGKGRGSTSFLAPGDAQSKVPRATQG